MRTMSPDRVFEELKGARTAVMYYITKRPNLQGTEIRRSADLLWEHWGKTEFADGFRDMAYIISQSRS